MNEESPRQHSRPLESDSYEGASATTPTNSLEAGIVADALALSGRYLLDEVLAVGSSCIVYKARDARRTDGQSSTAIAIKTLRPELQDDRAAIGRLKHEFRFAAALNHPSIVRVYALEQVMDKWFMTMELLDGQSLESLLYATQPRRLSTEQAFSILTSCSSALHCAHRQGIVHSDFKPANVWITTAQEVRVFDFGAARSCGSTPKELLSAETSAAGSQPTHSTSSYASPQVLAGNAAESSDDVFSLACVAYELLAGCSPFGRSNAKEMTRPNRRLTAPQGLPLQGWLALMRGLHYQSAVRTATAQGLLNELVNAFSPDTRQGRTHAGGQRNRISAGRLLNSGSLVRPNTWLRDFPLILTRNAIACAQVIGLSVHSRVAAWNSGVLVGPLTLRARRFFAGVTQRANTRLLTEWQLAVRAKRIIVVARDRLHGVRNSLDRVAVAARRRVASISVVRVRRLDFHSPGKQARRATRNRRFQHVRLNELMPGARRLSAGIAIAFIALPLLHRGLDSSKDANEHAPSPAAQNASSDLKQLAHHPAVTDATLVQVRGVAIRSSSTAFAHTQVAWRASHWYSPAFTPWQLITHSDDFARQTPSRKIQPPWRLGFGRPQAKVASLSTPHLSHKPRSTVTLEHERIHVSDHAVAAVLLLSRTGSTRDPMSVRWRTVVGSAKPGADYQETARGTARFTEYQSVRALYIPLKLNPTAQGSRSFVVELSGTSPGTALGGIKRSVVTIQKYE